MLFVLVGSVDVVLRKPQYLVRARSRLRQLPHGVGRCIVKLRSWRLLAGHFSVRLKRTKIGLGQVEMLAGINAPGPVQKLVVELLTQPALFGDDAVYDARLIALCPSDVHLGTDRTDVVIIAPLRLAVQRRRLLVVDEKRVEPEMEHNFLITQSCRKL